MTTKKCYHCGDECGTTEIQYEEKNFCCNGCKTVYDILSANGLSYYYDLESNAGSTPKEVEGKYDFLDNIAIAERLLTFNDTETQIVNLYIPNIHCSSCIWVLENVNKIHPGVLNTLVDFPKKTARITYNTTSISLKEVVILLTKIGYEPYISLDDYDTKKPKTDRSLLYKVAVAGFAFGNVMFLSFPEYFEVGEYWLEQYKNTFRWLMFAFSLPVVFYSGFDYLKTAVAGIRSKMLNIDVPIALGIIVLFLRSTYEIASDTGSGFFDSLTGLVFFLLLGRFFQQKTYAFLSFERDYKSYFPIAVTRITENKTEESIPINEIKIGDTLLIRNEELLPVDGILQSTKTKIDYSFVTGESVPVEKLNGDKVFAGGKQIQGAIEIQAIKTVSQSYLTQLWSNAVFQGNRASRFQNLTDRIGKRFTMAVLSIAFIATSFWLWHDPSKAMNVFTAVLIIACPCAIALAAPFTLGNMLRIFGRNKCYLKDTQTIERLATITTAVFDKTGTITTNTKQQINYIGIPLSESKKNALRSALRPSNHPLSRLIYSQIANNTVPPTADSFKEIVGQGIIATIGQHHIKLGSSSFVKNEDTPSSATTAVHLSYNGIYYGAYEFKNEYRKGIKSTFKTLAKYLKLAILSGDNDGETKNVQQLVPPNTPLYFNQKPEDKLRYIKTLQVKGDQVLMVGDGLNDAGALAQSNVGIAISENVNVFSPACDGILDASQITQLPHYIAGAKKAIQIIKWSFAISFLYNIIGLYFATTGQLKPVIAAILMPLSSISIVVFTTLATSFIGRKLKQK